MYPFHHNILPFCPCIKLVLAILLPATLDRTVTQYVSTDQLSPKTSTHFLLNFLLTEKLFYTVTLTILFLVSSAVDHITTEK